MAEQVERILDESTAHADPIMQFNTWFAEAVVAQPGLPNAMSLATAIPGGKPSVRIVLLKHADAAGFVFYTNYDSRKSREITLNPNVELCIYWQVLERQVRVEGIAAKTTAEESDDYFLTRPRESQLGAHASPQSEIIADRLDLERRFAALGKKFEGMVIPRPKHWGGYRVKPSRIEFWQGRQARLHDRLLYTRSADGSWTIQRLAP